MDPLIIKNLAAERPDVLATLHHCLQGGGDQVAITALAEFALQQFDAVHQQRWTLRGMLRMVKDAAGNDHYWWLARGDAGTVKYLKELCGLADPQPVPGGADRTSIRDIRPLISDD